MSHSCHSPVFSSVTRLLTVSESIAEVASFPVSALQFLCRLQYEKRENVFCTASVKMFFVLQVT